MKLLRRVMAVAGVVTAVYVFGFGIQSLAERTAESQAETGVYAHDDGVIQSFSEKDRVQMEKDIKILKIIAEASVEEV